MADPLKGLTEDAVKVILASKAGSWASKLLPSGLGLGAPSWLGMGARLAGTAGLAATTGYGAYSLAKEPVAKAFGIEDYYTTYQDYLKGGGNLSYQNWSAQGKPKSAQALMTKEQAEARYALAQVGAPERAKQEQERLKQEQQQKQGGQFPTTAPPQGYQWVWDNNTFQYVLNPIGQRGSTPEELALQRQQMEQQQGQQAWQRGQAEQTTQRQAEQDAWQRQQAELENQRQQAQQQSQQGYQQQQLGQQQQQFAQQMAWEQQQQAAQQAEQERQYKAQLASNPMSWLQYANYTGEAPAVQPWMLPLMPQQYAGSVAGEQIPNWQQGASMANLPGLTTPSMQYLARMGPTAQQGWLGYQQAQGGSRPEETLFRINAMSPPGGRNTGLSWAR